MPCGKYVIKNTYLLYNIFSDKSIKITKFALVLAKREDYPVSEQNAEMNGLFYNRFFDVFIYTYLQYKITLRLNYAYCII